MPSTKAVFEMLLSPLSLHTEVRPLFENAALLGEILTWGRESSRQVQDLDLSYNKLYCRYNCRKFSRVTLKHVG
jgi:hypothetical protein